MKKYTVLILALLLGVATVRAEKVTLRLDQVAALHGALTQLAPGLNPGNVLVVSGDINVLQDDAEAYQKMLTAAQRKAMRLPKTDDWQLKQVTITEEIELLITKTKEYDLQPLTLTEDEIKEAKIPPGQLAVVLRYLPKLKKP